MKTLLNRSLWWWLLLLIVAAGVTFGFVYTRRPFLMDDINYYIHHKIWLETHTWRHGLNHLAGMWLYVNGRLGDASNILWLNIVPEWMRGLIEGLCVAGFYAGAVLWLRRLGYGVVGCVITTAILMFALPWWDAFGLYVVHINYLWACTLLIFALYFLFWRMPKTFVGKAVLCIAMSLAGAWHEAIGLPMVFVLVIALAVRGIGRERVWPVIFGILGGLYSTASPGIWMRVADGHDPDDPALILALKTAPFAILLLVLLGVKLARNPRELWKQLTENQCRMGILTGLSLGSAALAVYSGFGGRAGWFAQITALLALAELWAPGLQRVFRRTPAVWTGVSVVLLVLMSIQTVLTPIYQLRYDAESKRLIDSYLHSDDGVVIADIPDFRSAPAILLDRAHPMPPVYDPWLQKSLRIYRASFKANPYDTLCSTLNDEPPLTLVPPEVASIIDSLKVAPATAIELPGATILPEGTGAIELPDGLYPQRIRYHGVEAVLHLPIPPGSRPWNN